LCRYSKGIVIRWNKPLSGLKPSIRIFDLHGAFVKELRLDSRIKKEAFWNGTTEMGLKVASGSYVISIENGKKVFGRILATIVNP
jgi:flagellar hook assembly protein FlgD